VTDHANSFATYADKHGATHDDWCRWLFDSLADRGEWIVPRSGLILQKHEADRLFVLIGMCDPADAEVDQGDDFDAIRAHFDRVGIIVTKGEK
jgi:hypothetical protein